MKIALLHDAPAACARPDELDGLAQARTVSAALAEAGHTVIPVPVSLDLAGLARTLGGMAPQRVFNLVEAPGGRGCWIHWIPTLLEGLGLSFTGAGSAATFLTSHKVMAKRWLRAHGLPTPEWFTGDLPTTLDAVPSRWVIKSIWEDASLGLDDTSVVRAEPGPRLAAELARRAPRLGGAAFAETYVEGREFNLSLLAKGADAEVLPPAEIRFEAWPPGKPRLVGYAAKWDADAFEYRNTPRCFDLVATDAPLVRRLEELARRCWRVFGLSGWARVDFRVDGSGRPWILELNANPCLSPDAGFLAAAERANLGLRDVLERIVAAAGPGGRRARGPADPP